MTHPRTAIVIEGGGLRGAFGAGVMCELARSGAPAFDEVVAVSSGAPTAAYYSTGQPDAGREIWSNYTHSAQLLAWRNLLRGSPLMDIDRLVGVFQNTVRLDHAALAGNRSRLWIGVTDCITGSARYVRATPTNVFELLRATMALPIANGRVVAVEGRPSIDGGVAEPVPVQHALDLAPERLLVVLTRPREYRRSAGTLRSFMIGWTYPRFPGVRAAMASHVRTANLTLEQIERLESAGALSVIRPGTALAATRLSRRKGDIDATIATGVDAARQWLDRQTWW